jgi:hypothetical protein
MSPCNFLDLDEEHETKQAPAGPDQQNIRTAYTELCISYRAIDDFREKLLGALPLASGTGIFFLYSYSYDDETKKYLLPIGIFGWVITLGLFAFEIYGIQKCHCIIKAGRSMEKRMGISGQFCNRPRAVRLPIVGDFVNEPLASGIIYPAVLAAWTFLALVFLPPEKLALTMSSTHLALTLSSTQIASRGAVLIFLLFFILSINFNRKLKSPKSDEVCKE